MKRWRSLSLRGGSGERRSSPLEWDSGSNRPVRAGFVAVYVGPERRRFVIPTRFLNLPVFASLLDRAEEEYGFQPAGGLALPCDPAFFRWVVDALERDEDRFKGLNLDAFLRLFADRASSSPCKKDPSYSSFAPLLSNTNV
ncbi:auxin-responsive protein SAUR24 isoform X2 [Phoenix dactylifera]|nr:auxin-responsive protein SAUR24 isoform X2 [Phoenix dactylifera]XP_038983782.1 auxin-responsive protein SAUR24 isoform X2 [Phoenix dactylifera]